MGRRQRTTQDNNIIILCEGSDTEVKYFNDIKEHVKNECPERFSKIEIIPLTSEVAVNPKTSRRRRNLKLEKPDYWVKSETDRVDYEEYKAQPVRYVRETQLFMQEDGYAEGWTVFDHDDFPQHEKAFKLAADTPNLNIAFSSISFEEWLLLHFERNPKKFLRSVCKTDRKDRGCGTGVPEDCHGAECVGGYIREKKHIADYAKSNENLFSSKTSKRLEHCFANAAWSKQLESGPVYERNPYTNVDELVKRLLGIDDKYEWVTSDKTFRLSGTDIKVTAEADTMTIENCGGISVKFIQPIGLLDDSLNIRREIELEFLPPHEPRIFEISDEEHILLFQTSGRKIYLELLR